MNIYNSIKWLVVVTTICPVSVVGFKFGYPYSKFYKISQYDGSFSYLMSVQFGLERYRDEHGRLPDRIEEIKCNQYMESEYINIAIKVNEKERYSVAGLGSMDGGIIIYELELGFPGNEFKSVLIMNNFGHFHIRGF
jgi:hypothetical protein